MAETKQECKRCALGYQPSRREVVSGHIMWLHDGITTCPNSTQYEQEYQQRLKVVRCTVTGNPCGTDTWAAGKSCSCDNCQRWMQEQKATGTVQ